MSVPVGKRRNKQKKPLLHASKVKKLSEKTRIEQLNQDALDFVPTSDLKAFTDLAISDFTKRGLRKAFFVNMTEIQSQSLPVSLKGKDVLAAARTGSGKTLAFLIPVLEMLYRQKWGPSDGLGALIVSPTRELAVQIFEVLRSIGGYHSFSAGLIIGGKDVKGERDRLAKMNIVVATPGRLLQHMDQTWGFDCNNLQMLVLDEADRILDMGFYKTLSALLSHLPTSRQTLLFSATQTQSVSDLARLSLKDPVPIGLKDDASQSGAVPDTIDQHYLLCPLDQKLSILWGFIKTHLHAKTLVFLSSCKQVRFVYETFCAMHPGIPLIHLHGKQKQTARLTMYNKFIASKHSVLFATDIAARGLDFPSVDWVVQVDAPEDAETYIHRVGRTARYESKGKALLFMMPSEEEGMKAVLEKRGVEVTRLKFKASKTESIQNQLQSLAFQNPEIKYLGQRAFVSYLRSIYLHKDKTIFKLNELPVDAFAESLGLPGTPKIKFLSKERQKKNAVKELEPKAEGVRTKYNRMFERKNQNVLSEHYAKLVDNEDESSDEDDFITLARADHELEDGPLESIRLDNLSNRKMKLGRAKKQMLLNAPQGRKLVFDESGTSRVAHEVMPAEEWVESRGGVEGIREEGERYVMGERGRMREADVVDKEEAREKKREKKRKRKGREAEAEAAGVELASADEDDGYISPEFDLSPEPKRMRVKDMESRALEYLRHGT